MEIGQWRFLVVCDLWGRTVRRQGGDRIGTVAATVRCGDDGIDLLVRGSRGRVTRIPLDNVSIEGDGALWLRPVFRVVRADGGDGSGPTEPVGGGVPVLIANGRQAERDE